MKEFFLISGTVLGLILFLFALILVPVIYIDSVACHNRFDDSNVESRFEIIGGCQVNDPNMGWIPSENYRVF